MIRALASAEPMIKDLKEAFEQIDPYLVELIERSSDERNDVSIFEPRGIHNFGEFF